MKRGDWNRHDGDGEGVGEGVGGDGDGDGDGGADGREGVAGRRMGDVIRGGAWRRDRQRPQRVVDCDSRKISCVSSTRHAQQAEAEERVHVGTWLRGGSDARVHGGCSSFISMRAARAGGEIGRRTAPRGDYSTLRGNVAHGAVHGAVHCAAPAWAHPLTSPKLSATHGVSICTHAAIGCHCLRLFFGDAYHVRLLVRVRCL